LASGRAVICGRADGELPARSAPLLYRRPAQRGNAAQPVLCFRSRVETQRCPHSLGCIFIHAPYKLCSGLQPHGLAKAHNSSLHRGRYPALAAIRYRRPHKPHPRLRDADGDPDLHVPGYRCLHAVRDPHVDGAGVATGGSGLHARHRRPVQSAAPQGAGVCGPPLLPQEVRRKEDP
jgi:hypothetical protein